MQLCAACAHRIELASSAIACPRCGGLLEIVHDAAWSGLDAAALKALFLNRMSAAAAEPANRSGVWRYRELVYPDGGIKVISFPEGNTPLLYRKGLADWAGVDRLQLKHEGLNPTGSFKDRGMSVAVTQGVRVGATAVACASTGNTSSSLAAYAGIAGIPALVMVPQGQVSAGKLAQTIAYGARTILVRGDFDTCLRLVREASEKLGVYLVNSLNPFRIEGQKTIILELLQQLEWEPPDWIVLPAGNLGNASAFGKALREARQLGLIDRTPRLLLVQAEGAAPFARSYESGFAERRGIAAKTIATAIRIGDPASWDRAVRVVRETNGVVVSVPDREILEAKHAIDTHGVGCEPASAATLAGVRELRRRGEMDAGANVVAVLTGHLLKDPLPSAPELFSDPRAAVEVEPTLHAVEAVLNSPRD